MELDVGWEKENRIHDCVIHLDIIDGKVWVQCDNTNRPVAEDLVEGGIPKEDIVLAFHPPRLWKHTGFGVTTPSPTG